MSFSGYSLEARIIGSFYFCQKKEVAIKLFEKLFEQINFTLLMKNYQAGLLNVDRNDELFKLGIFKNTKSVRKTPTAFYMIKSLDESINKELIKQMQFNQNIFLDPRDF